MDDETYWILNDMHLSEVVLISIADFEWENKRLAEAKKNRSLMEYYFTCTPSLIDYVIKKVPEKEVLTYLDADLFFFSSIEPVYQELTNGSVLIIEHRFSYKLRHLEKYGHYNVGLVAFRNNTDGLTCLGWWRDRCLEWCYDRLEGGKFADQKYLDEWAYKFKGVIVLQHYGAGLAPWNLANYSYLYKTMGTITPGLFVNGAPLIMYHFHGVRRIIGKWWDIDLNGYKTALTYQTHLYLYLPYIYELNRVEERLSKYNWHKQKPIRKRFEEWTSLKNVVTNLVRIGLLPINYYLGIIFMSLEGDKEHILSGIYNAKELLFFFIGLATLVSIPFLEADRVGTYQLVVIGAILTLEGFSSVVEMWFNFMIQRCIPWIENEKRKRKFRRG
jgi:hypothetical protein